MKYENVNLNEMHSEKMQKLLTFLNPNKESFDRANKMLTEFRLCDQTNISMLSNLLFASQILNTAWNCLINHPDIVFTELQKEGLRDRFINQVHQILEIVTDKEEKL